MIVNIAQTIANQLGKRHWSAITFEGGYATNILANETSRFLPGTLIKKKCNAKGRTILASYLYTDNSVLIYRYNTHTDTYSIESKD